MMASRIKRRRNYFLLSKSSDSECSIPVYRRKKLKRIIVGQSSLKEYYDHSTDEDGNSDHKFINRKEIEDINAEFKSRNKGNPYHANVKSVIESKGKHSERVINFWRKYKLHEDSNDSYASSDDGSSDRMYKVEVMGSNRKIDNGTSSNKYDASNPVTSTPFPQNKQGNKKNQEVDINIRHRIMKMSEKLKYMLSKFKLEVYGFQLKYLQDEIVTEQDREDIMYIYNSIINKLKKELTVQQQISMGPCHRRGETEAHSQSSSKICSANTKRPEVTKTSKPDVKNNANKQPVEANCTSAVTVEENNNTTSNSNQSLISHLHRLPEIKVVKTPSTTSVAGSVNTVHSVPSLEVLNRAYEKSIGRQDTTKQDSLRNGRVKEKGLLTNYESDVNSTCSTIALCPRRNGIVEINNYQGGLKHAFANKDVSSRDVSNRDVSNRDVSNRDVSSRDVLNRDVSNRDVSNRDVSNRDVLNGDVSNRDVSKSPMLDISSVDGEESDEISLTNLYSSDSEDTSITSNNKIENLKHRSKEHIPAKGKTVLTSSNSENNRPKQRSEFVVPDENNLSRKYRSHHVAISNRAVSVLERKPTEQNQYNTRVDKKLLMNCKVLIENLTIKR